MNAGDEICQNECLKNPPKIQEFVGPVKIILVDPTPAYYPLRAWGSAFVALGNLVMGAVVSTMILFTLFFGLPMAMNAHIAACTTGFQVLLPSGILMLNPLFGPTAQLKRSHRTYQHIFFQHMSVAFGFGGGVYVLLCVSFSVNIHTITGIVAMCSMMSTVLLGPLIFFCDPIKWPFIRRVRSSHKAMGILTFASSSACFCTGCLKTSFARWARRLDLIEMPLVMCVMCTAYTIIFTIAIRWRSKFDK